jgi:hypothetical protein
LDRAVRLGDREHRAVETGGKVFVSDRLRAHEASFGDNVWVGSAELAVFDAAACRGESCGAASRASMNAVRQDERVVQPVEPLETA